jgi:carbon monoxide dehydrogenase subunit G
MAVELKEVVSIEAPLGRVWRFLLSPENLVACMPGAELTERVDEQSFKGTLKMRVGAISATYAGTVTYQTVNEAEHTVVLLAQAEDTTGGTATGTITSTLKPLADDSTEVHVQSSIDLTGRLVQVGRGMIDGVAKQVINIFVTNVKEHMKAETIGQEVPRGREDEALNLLAVLWAALRAFIQRLFGGAPR